MSDRACIRCGNTTGHDLIGGACITCDFGTCDDCDTLRARLAEVERERDEKTALLVEVKDMLERHGVVIDKAIADRAADRARIVDLECERATVMPRCRGTWLKGSGGHRRYAGDCAAPGRWNTGMGWVCDAHKSPHGGDADAWTVCAELSLLRDAVEAAGGDVRAEQVLIAEAERNAGRVEIERLVADLDAVCEKCQERCPHRKEVADA